MKVPRGFSFAGAHAGLKATRKDVALVWSDAPCAAAGRFTINAAAAAPVRDAAARLPRAGIQALVLNSGNANALTGPAGARDVRTVCDAYARVLDVDPSAVLCASTGVIGVRLPVQKLVDVAPALLAARSKHVEPAAEAIFTTDTRLKLASRTVLIPHPELGEREVVVSGFAKGSGMVAPELATMMAVLTTDATLSPAHLDGLLGQAIDSSFSCLVVDGEMSTNDAVFALANGRAGAPAIQPDHPSYALLAAAFWEVCTELARAIAEDGEGATKLLEVTVEGVADGAIARDLAKSVCGSTLVKAAVFGADPNWGRVLAALGGRIGARRYPIDPMGAAVRLQGIAVFEGGSPTSFDQARLRARMREPLVRIDVAFGGEGAAVTAWGCDLSYDYVKINADYMSFTSASEDGKVTRDDRLTNYSPAFKRTLITQALDYIARFAGTRAVIKYGGAAMVKDSLKASFARDVNLLRTAGLLPVVVHGGGPELERALAHFGPADQASGRGVSERNRTASEADQELMEMVLSGRINSELVSLLNQEKAWAVGLSGKDAGFLRAKPSEDSAAREAELETVDRTIVEVLLDKGYVPVVSPVALGNDGGTYPVNADDAAADIARALGAEKLIYVTDVPGVLQDGELLSEMDGEHARTLIGSGVIHGGMRTKIEAGLRALAGGVRSVHVIDGRTPHGLIAELFTERGVGTLLRADAHREGERKS